MQQDKLIRQVELRARMTRPTLRGRFVVTTLIVLPIFNVPCAAGEIFHASRNSEIGKSLQNFYFPPLFSFFRFGMESSSENRVNICVGRDFQLTVVMSQSYTFTAIQFRSFIPCDKTSVFHPYSSEHCDGINVQLETDEVRPKIVEILSFMYHVF